MERQISILQFEVLPKHYLVTRLYILSYKKVGSDERIVRRYGNQKYTVPTRLLGDLTLPLL